MSPMTGDPSEYSSNSVLKNQFAPRQMSHKQVTGFQDNQNDT